MRTVGTAAKGGVIHISTGTYYLLPRYPLFGVIAPTGRGRENRTPGPTGYKVPACVGWCGEGKEIDGSPGVVVASGDPGALAAVEAWVVAVLAGPADGAQ